MSGKQYLIDSFETADDSADILLPASRGIEAIHLLSGSAARGAVNRARLKPNAAVVGQCYEAPDRLGFQARANYLQTRTPEHAQMTFYSVVRSLDTMVDAGTQPMYYGNFTSPAAIGTGDTYGVGLFSTGAASYRAEAGRGTSVDDDINAEAALAADTVRSFSLLVHTVGATSSTLYNATTGNSAASSTGPRFRATGLLRIGSGYQTFSGACEMALWIAASVAHTTDERDRNLEFIRAEVAEQGIVI